MATSEQLKELFSGTTKIWKHLLQNMWKLKQEHLHKSEHYKTQQDKQVKEMRQIYCKR